MTSRRPHRFSRHGQSVVEFAIVLPLVLLIVLSAVDFGRAFYSWVALNNATRIGADYAAAHPYAWDGIPSPTDAIQIAEYQARIQRELGNIPCTHPVPGPPVFPGGSLALGQPAKVGLSCSFSLITPVIGAVMGSVVHLSASSIFPIRAGLENKELPLPPCFNQAVVPFLVGLKPSEAQVQVQSVGLVPNGVPDPTLKGKPNDVKSQTPDPGLCVDLNSTVTYVYKP